MQPSDLVLAFMTSGYVYVIDPHIQINGKPVVKIGMTTRNPHKRLRELQTALPHKASLVRAVQFPNAEAAERSLHKSLNTYRVQGGGGMEFFFLNPSDAVQIVNKLAYQVSAWEAKAALDRELERFSEQISGGLASRIGKWSIAAVFVGIFVFFTSEEGNFTSAFLRYYLQHYAESGFSLDLPRSSSETPL